MYTDIRTGPDKVLGNSYKNAIGDNRFYADILICPDQVEIRSYATAERLYEKVLVKEFQLIFQ